MLSPITVSDEYISLSLFLLIRLSSFKESVETGIHLDPSLKEVAYNPTYDTMFAPEVKLMDLLNAIILVVTNRQPFEVF